MRLTLENLFDTIKEFFVLITANQCSPLDHLWTIFPPRVHAQKLNMRSYFLCFYLTISGLFRLPITTCGLLNRKNISFLMFCLRVGSARRVYRDERNSHKKGAPNTYKAAIQQVHNGLPSTARVTMNATKKELNNVYQVFVKCGGEA